jgi:hypothetical protein
MASMKDKIENGQIFERLVVERYKNSIASGIRINEISAIETRAKSLIKAQNEHYKKNYEAFVNQETFRQISLRRTKDTGDNTPAVSRKDYDACRRIAQNVVNDRFRMKMLKIDQASERMQLREIAKKRQVNEVTRAYRVKERGATLTNKLKSHHAKQYDSFVVKQFKKDLAAYENASLKKSKQVRSDISVSKLEKIREGAEAKVTNRHEARLSRVEQTTDKMHRQMIKQAKQTHRQRMW